MPSALHQTTWILAIVATLSAACGREGDPLPDSAPAVKLATLADTTAARVVPQSYIVTFRGALHQSARHHSFGSFAAEASHHYRQLLNPVVADPRVKSLRYISSVDLSDPKDPERVRALSPPRALLLAWNASGTTDIPATITQVDFTSAAAAAAALHEWDKRKLIWFAEPNYQSHLSQASASLPELVTAYSTMALWWHTSIHLVDAFNAIITKGVTPGKPVVAVLDSGVDGENQWLKDNIWLNLQAGNAACGNDVHGCNATEADRDILGNGDVFPYLTSGFGQECPFVTSTDKKERSKADSCGHGTHVAGIIAAAPNGSGDTAIGGVCPFCKIMIIKVIKEGVAADSAILSGFKYLANYKQTSGDDLVRVANASIGTYNHSRAIALLVSVLSRSPNNVLVVSAAGNEDAMIRSYPAGYPEALAVAATAQDDSKAIYSNFGSWIGIAAPGGDSSNGAKIVSTIPGVSGRDGKQGTSMASPVVAGVAGLVLSVDPTRSAADLRASLIRTADPRLYDAGVGYNSSSYYPAYPDEGRIPLLGSGIVDAAAAIANDRSSGVRLDVDDTVTRGCGTLSDRENKAPADLAMLTLALGLPLLRLLRDRRVRIAVDHPRHAPHAREGDGPGDLHR